MGKGERGSVRGERFGGKEKGREDGKEREIKREEGMGKRAAGVRVWGRERERERQTDSQTNRDRERTVDTQRRGVVCVQACMFTVLATC